MLVVIRYLVEVFRQLGSSGMVSRSSRTSLRNSSMPSFCDDELEARLVAVFLLAEPGEDAADRAGQRQQFFFGKKFVEELGLMGTAPSPPPT